MKETTIHYSVLLPVYNEGKTLRAIIAHIRAMDHLRLEVVPMSSELPLEIAHLEQEIVAVDDGSGDDSWEILQAAEAQGLLKAVRHERNQGKGAAIRTAMQTINCGRI